MLVYQIVFISKKIILCFSSRVQQPDQANDGGPPSRPGSQMEQGMTSSTSGTAIQNTKSKTTSAPTSPLKEKKSSFFGKVPTLILVHKGPYFTHFF